MNIIAVDDEELALQNILGLLGKAEPDAVLHGFDEAEDAFAYLAQNNVDIAFLDIDLPDINGIALAKKCRELCPNVNIIFATGYQSYAIDAFKLHASGYLLKPVRMDELRAELDNLRRLPSSTKKLVRVQTFGYFEVFLNGKPLKFTRAKCRECLAYLIDRRGARVTYPDLSAVLWGERPLDRKVQNNTQKTVSDLMKTLNENGLQNLVLRSHQSLAIDTSMLDCDYYTVLNGDTSPLKAFTGEYMSNYEWAEETTGELTRMAHT